MRDQERRESSIGSLCVQLSQKKRREKTRAPVFVCFLQCGSDVCTCLGGEEWGKGGGEVGRGRRPSLSQSPSRHSAPQGRRRRRRLGLGREPHCNLSSSRGSVARGVASKQRRGCIVGRNWSSRTRMEGDGRGWRRLLHLRWEVDKEFTCRLPRLRNSH